MKKLHLLALSGLLILGFAGCEKVKVQNEASVDVFVKSIKNDQGIAVYTTIHSVVSYNGSLTAASVKSPDGTITQLTSDATDPGFSLYNVPAEADYLPSMPATAAGVYTYTVKFDDGEEKNYTNSLSAITLMPANITSLVKSADGDSVYISYEPIANVQLYQLRIYKGTTEVIQPYLTETPVRIGELITKISSGSSGDYTFKLNGYYFESSASYNIQAISTAEMDITL